jgi:hypothetical protein
MGTPYAPYLQQHGGFTRDCSACTGAALVMQQITWSRLIALVSNDGLKSGFDHVPAHMYEGL